MKILTALFFVASLVLIAAAAACKRTPIPSGEVSFVSTSNQGDLIKIAAIGYGSKEHDIIADAERRAIETLLFVGLTGSSVQSPMVTDPNARETQKEYLKQLLDEKGYRRYVSAPGVANNIGKDKRTGKKSALVNLEVNVLALRRELERQNLTRKFGL
jgi:hypothetical protein